MRTAHAGFFKCLSVTLTGHPAPLCSVLNLRLNFRRVLEITVGRYANIICPYVVRTILIQFLLVEKALVNQTLVFLLAAMLLTAAVASAIYVSSVAAQISNSTGGKI
ncbi:MAG: hypothetical protein WCF23_15025 [Candidatus Nitrosopolaris sp.]